MKKRSTTLALLLIISAFLALATIFAGAESEPEAEKLFVSLASDKSDYKRKDTIKVLITLENTNYHPLNDVSVKARLPKELKIIDQSSIAEPLYLSPGESRTVAITAKYASGSLWIILVIIGALALGVGGYFLYRKKHPKNKTGKDDGPTNDSLTTAVCLLLCVSLLSAFLPLVTYAKADDTIESEATETKTIESVLKVDVAKNSYKIKVTATYPPVTVSAYVASLFGINADDFDSDGDGLGNYIELYHCGTDPSLTDSDGNGIIDSEEDTDNDGLTNIQEQLYSSNPGEADTDGDGLSDYQESLEYNTNPCKNDTDGDGLSDRDEVLIGLDPLSEKTDGKTLDSKRVMTQELCQDNIDEVLTNEENEATPSLTVTTAGSINNNIFITKNESNAFGDSRAILGEPIDIDCEGLPEGKITFTLKKNSIDYMDSSSSVNTRIICKYNDNGSIEYLETDYDKSNNTLSANISEGGTYYVLDVQKMFDEMGLEFPDLSKLSDTSKNGSGTVLLSSASDSSSKTTRAKNGYVNVMAQADIVFIIDSTGSMGDEINNVKSNVRAFLNALNENNISASLALIDYKDIQSDGTNSTVVHKNGTSNWFYDISSYENAISSLRVSGGGDFSESTIDALETGRLLDMRPSAGKIFILVTDADYKIANRYGIGSMSAEIQLLKNAGISCAVVSPSSEKSDYYDLYTETNGIWADIYGDFHSALIDLAEKMGTEIVGDGFWIYLDGPVPMPVRLDEEPTKGSKVDTDGDNLYDIDELESATPSRTIDLDELLTIVSKGAITGTEYGSVMAYRYKSNPALVDTDYDGISDDKDEQPLSNYFSGKMNGSRNLNSIDYTFDLHYFLDSNFKYDVNMAKISLLLSNIIYDASSVTYDRDGVTVSRFEDMLIKHGFDESAHVYSLKEEGNYTDDHISDVGYGYIDVEHNGRTIRVIVASVRGTDSSIEEWSSNFDMGNTSEWGYAYHKGFYIAEERIRSQLYTYTSSLDYEGITDTVFWITGHSRGAAIANILAANLIDDGYRTVAYTFATPATTTKNTWDDNKYNTIYNFTNLNDVVGYVPFSQWGFHRFGITYSFEIDNFANRKKWSNQTGEFSYDSLSTKLINLLFDRIYKYCCNSWDNLYEYSGAQNLSDEQYGYLSERAKEKCKLERRYDKSGKENGWKIYPNTAFILQILAELIASNPEEEKTNGKILFEFLNTKYAAAILIFVGDGLGTYYLKNGMITSLAFKDLIWDTATTIPGVLSMDVLTDTHSLATYYVMLPERIKT